MYKLDIEVWNKVENFLRKQAEGVSLECDSGIEKNNYIMKELERVEQEIEKKRVAAKRTMKLFAVLEDEQDVNEIKNQLKEIRDEEKELKKIHEELSEKLNEGDSPNQKLVKESVDYYMSLSEVTEKDKRHTIRLIVREVVLTEDAASVYLY